MFSSTVYAQCIRRHGDIDLIFIAEAGFLAGNGERVAADDEEDIADEMGTAGPGDVRHRQETEGCEHGSRHCEGPLPIGAIALRRGSGSSAHSSRIPPFRRARQSSASPVHPTRISRQPLQMHTSPTPISPMPTTWCVGVTVTI